MLSLGQQKFQPNGHGRDGISQRAVVKVQKEGLEPEEFGTTEEKWKRISLQFPAEKVSDPANYAWLFPLLEEVNFLSLSLHKRKSVYQINFHPLVGQMLSTCTKLKSLAMEPDFIRYGFGNTQEFARA